MHPAGTPSSTRSSHSATASAAASQEADRGLVYWDERSQPAIPKRTAALAGIPSPSKPATHHSPLVDSLNLQTNKPLRFSKRRKSRTDHEPQENRAPAEPPLIPKKKAWAELTSRLKRRELDAAENTADPHIDPKTNPAADSLPPRVGAPSNAPDPQHQPNPLPNEPPQLPPQTTPNGESIPTRNHPNVPRQPSAPIREAEEDASSHKPGPAPTLKNDDEGKMKEQNGCEPWEEDEDPDFGSQLLLLAERVEQGQKASQETVVPSDRNLESPATTTATTTTTTTTSDHSSAKKTILAPTTATNTWKTVDHKKKPLPAPSKPPLTHPHPRPLAPKTAVPTKTVSKTTVGSRTMMGKQPQPAAPGASRSPIIYRTALVSKAALPTHVQHPIPMAIKSGAGKPKTVGDGRWSVGGGGAKLADQGQATARPESAAPKPSYSDALLNRPTRRPAVRIDPHKLSGPPPSAKDLPLIPARHPDLDLDSLFCGIQGDDLDWDPDDQ
ncbi:hypothetical protein PTTG_00918 [Puccinia triticina 1-1 BBBD Race 1]|uniref:Uncharacterized protein n=1 Tax=Puccinia triticina (isolate 1-1 / race 1 (BBBD)) TaxID=630390 RepID=A0A180GL97_PUCT1|nr:hypothetical protein PTTG_00918 [Puccinia triticina 1-1 BBBD Race 1]